MVRRVSRRSTEGRPPRHVRAAWCPGPGIVASWLLLAVGQRRLHGDGAELQVGCTTGVLDFRLLRAQIGALASTSV